MMAVERGVMELQNAEEQTLKGREWHVANLSSSSPYCTNEP
jgi:hypothetical protein